MKARLPYFFVSSIFILSIILLFVALVISSLSQEITIDIFTTDLASYADLPSYTGMFSNLGILFWRSTATITIFCSCFLSSTHRNNFSSFLFYGGLLSLMLLCDDLFLFHESNDGLITAFFNISQRAVFMIYGMLTIFYLAKFRHVILQSGDLGLLIISLILFFASITIDMGIIAYDFPSEGKILLEDGAKFLGIISWFSYFLLVSWRSMLEAITKC